MPANTPIPNDESNNVNDLKNAIDALHVIAKDPQLVKRLLHPEMNKLEDIVAYVEGELPLNDLLRKYHANDIEPLLCTLRSEQLVQLYKQMEAELNYWSFFSTKGLKESIPNSMGNGVVYTGILALLTTLNPAAVMTVSTGLSALFLQHEYSSAVRYRTEEILTNIKKINPDIQIQNPKQETNSNYLNQITHLPTQLLSRLGHFSFRKKLSNTQDNEIELHEKPKPKK